MKSFDENMTYATKEETEFLDTIKEYTENSAWDITPIQAMKLSTEDQHNALGTHEATEWFIECNTLSGTVNLPLAEMSMKSITERAGIKGPALSALATTDFIDVVNKCANVCTGIARLFTVEGKLYAAHSENYVVLDMDSVFALAAQKVESIYPKAKFLGGYLDHSIAVCEYDLSAHTEIAEEYNALIRKIADDSGRPYTNWNIKPLIRFTTSNTGLSGANIYPYLTRDGIAFPAGKAITLEHKGGASLEKYSENLDMMYAAAKKAYSDIAKLKEIVIKHPRKCMQNIAQRVGLPKKP